MKKRGKNKKVLSKNTDGHNPTRSFQTLLLPHTGYIVMQNNRSQLRTGVMNMVAEFKLRGDHRLYNFALIGGLPYASQLDPKSEKVFVPSHRQAEMLQYPCLCLKYGRDLPTILQAIGESADRCGSCNAPWPRHRCARCRAVRYCSADCQKDHWKGHKKSCRKPLLCDVVTVPGGASTAR